MEKDRQVLKEEDFTKQSGEEIKLEEAFDKLDEMIGKLESRETSLDESFQVYQKGMELLKYCNEKIDTVEKKILLMNDNGETDEF